MTNRMLRAGRLERTRVKLKIAPAARMHQRAAGCRTLIARDISQACRQIIFQTALRAARRTAGWPALPKSSMYLLVGAINQSSNRRQWMDTPRIIRPPIPPSSSSSPSITDVSQRSRSVSFPYPADKDARAVAITHAGIDACSPPLRNSYKHPSQLIKPSCNGIISERYSPRGCQTWHQRERERKADPEQGCFSTAARLQDRSRPYACIMYATLQFASLPYRRRA